MTTPELPSEVLEPYAGDLIESLRAFGYDAATALADLVDNSIAATASHVSINYCTDPGRAWVAILDNGRGMSETELHEAMRFARSPRAARAPKDLGRFGLGLKTASLSQARELTVLSRVAAGHLATRTWDVDQVLKSQQWRVETEADTSAMMIAEQLGFNGTGTLVLWRKLDNLGEGSALSRRVSDAGRQLSLLFHRFMAAGQLELRVGGHLLSATDPYLLTHSATQDLGTEVLEFRGHYAKINPVVLPHPARLSRTDLEKASGPGGMMAHQGFYVYRGDRLVVAGSWLGLGRMLRTATTRLARIAVDLDPGSDLLWDVDVRKSSVMPPAPIERRMTEIAEHARDRSERVFMHRGSVENTSKTAPSVQPVWQRVRRHGRSQYWANREHPFIVEALGAEPQAVEGLLRLLETSLPIESISHEAAMSTAVPTGVEADADVDEILATFRSVLAGLSGNLATRKDLANALASAEPFNRHPGLIREIIESSIAEEA